jgi:putative endonuclease
MPYKTYCVYILTNKTKTVLYIGVTNNIKIRLYQHNNPKPDSNSFTKRYNVFYLVYYEKFNNILLAIAREKEIKAWRREKKDNLINSFNPEWKFLNDELL